MSKLLVFLILQFPVYTLAQQKIEFISEKIDFEINPNNFKINGLYCFINNSTNEFYQTILFPFPKEADSIKVKRVYNLTYTQNLVFQKVANGIVFKLVIMPVDTIYVNILYTQKTKKKNTYILKSIQKWGKPLNKAEFSLTYKNTIIVDSLSFKPDSLINNVYYWTKQDFFPDNNFNVWIK